MVTVLDGELEQQGDLELTSPDFGDGGQLPDWTGLANDNENPRLEISGVPDDAGSLVLVVDDPDAEPVVGHVFDHWLVWNVDPDQGTIPRDWDPEADGADVGWNDLPSGGWCGPSPPEGTGTHTYQFKLVALDNQLETPESTRKQRLGSTIAFEAEVLATTQLDGTYDPSQGTAF